MVNFTVRHRPMPLRFVGALLIALAASFVALAVYEDHTWRAISAMPGAWTAPVSKQLFLQRIRLWEAYLVGSAALMALAGTGMLLRRWWPLPLYGATLAALLLATFSWLTQLLAPRDFQFDTSDPLGLLMGSIVGLFAALGFMFRPRRLSVPDKRSRDP